MRVTMAGLTDAGRRRENNEDALAWDEDRGLAVLADGMGGHRAGEVASGLAVALFMEQLVGIRELPDAGVLSAMATAITDAHRAILAWAERDPQCAGMGTTLVATHVRDGAAFIAHVGDSRVYRSRDGKLQPLTSDHTLVQELVDSGALTSEQARASTVRNVVTRALGVGEQVEVTRDRCPLQPGDQLLLCSDGLTDMVAEEEIQAILADMSEPQSVAETLVRRANDRGGADNISVILIRLPMLETDHGKTDHHA